jgi:ribonuclease BN (tRNA processing enzyme)
MAASIGIYPLGIGSFGSTRLWHNTFVLLVDGERFVVDCPNRLQPMLEDNKARGALPVSIADYDHVLLTHLHKDHAGGLVELAQAGQLSPDWPMRLFAPQPMLDYLWSQTVELGVISAADFAGGAADLDRYFRPVPLDNPHDFGSFQLRYRPTQHIPNTFAYLFDFGDYKLGYSADTAFDETLIHWLDQCDTVLHEVLGPPWSEVEAVQKLHAPLAKLLELPQAFQRKTYLCHVDEDRYLEQSIGDYRYLEQQRLYRLKGRTRC